MVDVLTPAFYPKSIAIIGASKDPKKRGHQAILALKKDFAGAVYPVNPKEAQILDLPCYPEISTVDDTVDLALICTPAFTIPSLIKACGQHGVKACVVLSGGFAELGEEGRALQASCVDMARRYGTRIIGPNTSGLFNTHAGVNLLGLDVPKGELGILSQSGNMALALLTEAEVNNEIGFSSYVGVGNEADIDMSDYLCYFAEDDNTKAVACYLEGVKNGERLLQVAREVTANKPVVVYKSGRTAAGVRAVQSHTGALAGDFEVSLAAFNQVGVTVVDATDELLPTAQILSNLPALTGRRVLVLADGGGHATIMTDALIKEGLLLAELSSQTIDRLQSLLPEAASCINPVDIAGAADASPGVFADCLQIALEDDNVDGVIIVGLFGGYHQRFAKELLAAECEAASRILDLQASANKPVILHSVYARLQSEPLDRLRFGKLPVAASPELIAKVLGHAYRRYQFISANKTHDHSAKVNPLPAVCALLANAREEGRAALYEPEARQILALSDIECPPMMMMHSENDVDKVIDLFGEGCALATKIVSQDILHKTDAAGVILDVAGVDSLRAAYCALISNAKAYKQSARIEGVMVTPMASSGGLEIIVGVNTDAQFGKVVMCGLGGTFVEIFKDVSFRVAPLSHEDALGMLAELKASKILQGARGDQKYDIHALAKLIVQLGNVALAYPSILEVDLNPVRLYHSGLSVLDARMLLSDC